MGSYFEGCPECTHTQNDEQYKTFYEGCCIDNCRRELEACESFHCINLFESCYILTFLKVSVHFPDIIEYQRHAY